MLRLLPAGLLAALVGMMAVAGRESASNNLEPLLEPARITTTGVKLRVTTGGCTAKEDFKVKRLKDDGYAFQLVRVRPDHCEAFLPMGTEIELGFEELGLSTPVTRETRARIEFVNPIDPDRKHHG